MNKSVFCFLVLALTSVVLASRFQIHGSYKCKCDTCYSVANVQLWEKDYVTPDNFQDDAVVRNGNFRLLFDEYEFYDIVPYLVIQHDCAPQLWNKTAGRKIKGHEYCYVEDRQYVRAPDHGEYFVDTEVQVGNDPDYEKQETCVDESNFLGMFGSRPKSRPSTTTKRPPATSEHPKATSEFLPAISERPEANSELPEETSELLPATSEHPKAASELPLVTSELPAAISERPEETTELLPTTSERPTATSEVPDDAMSNFIRSMFNLN